MKRFLAFIILIFCTTLFAKETFLEADTKCMARKNELLKQARGEKVTACKKSNQFGGQANACEQFYADYGNAVFDPMGFQIKKGIFDDIPECLRALELQSTTERY